MENTEGMTNQEGIQFLERIMRIKDFVILGYNNSFSELEQEKNLPSGAIVRQSLRLSNIKIIIKIGQNFFIIIYIKLLPRLLKVA